ncbi:MAG: ABC transporter permease [Deltaproteobacteria bacterium]|nr:ABC transporter permease [Deltaproteobacteria bacterium]
MQKAGKRGRAWAVALAAVVRKEVRQTLRDRRVMFLLIVAPLLQTVILGYAVDFDFENVPTLVVDLDRTATSRMHARRLLADHTLQRQPGGASVTTATAELRSGKAAAAIVLPPGLERDVLAERPAEVQVLLDGTDPNRAMVVASAAARYFGETAEDLLRERLARAHVPPPPVIRAEPRALYNPGLETAPFMMPGVMTMLLVITTTIVTAMGLSREREMGTLEQVLVTPIPPLVLLLGKMTPPLVIGCFDVFLVLTAGVWLFGVPVSGPPAVLAAGTLLYLVCTLGIGLLISSVSKTQQQSFLAGFLFIMPAILLSGVMTPVQAMPAWLRMVTYVNPVRYFIEVLRGNLLKGAGFADLWWRLGALGMIGVIILFVATMRLRKRMA